MLTGLDGAKSDIDQLRLTRAQAHALRRSAPVTHAKLQEHFKGLGAALPDMGELQVRSERDAQMSGIERRRTSS